MALMTKDEIVASINKSASNMQRVREAGERLRKGFASGGEDIIKTSVDLQSVNNNPVDSIKR